MLVEISDTRLNVVERGAGDATPLLVLHGGPGLDHHYFGDYLDRIGADRRLLLVDQRAHGRSDPAPEQTWTLERMARDVSELAAALGLERYAVLGHSFGSFVALVHAVEQPGAAAATIVSHGIPSERFLDHVEVAMAAMEPPEIREQVAASWEAEKTVTDAEGMRALLIDQFPFHFADPQDPRIPGYVDRTTPDAIYNADMLRRAANEGYGHIEVEDRLGEVTQPVLVLASRHDRVCSVNASVNIATGIHDAELHVFEDAGHFAFAEVPEEYVATVRSFLAAHA
jgi:proline-specific peptidase